MTAPPVASPVTRGVLARAIPASVWLLVASEAANVSVVTTNLIGVSPYPLLLGIASVMLFAGLLSGQVKPAASPTLVLLGVFVASQCLAVLFARDGELAFEALFALAKDCWFFVVVVLIATSMMTAWTLATAVVVPMTVLSTLTLVNEFVLGGGAELGGFASVSSSLGEGAATSRHAGPVEDPNFWGRLLILAVPLALSLAARSARNRSNVTSALWSASVVLLCGGVYLTQSRGALLGLGLVVLLWFAVVSARSRRALLTLPVLLVLVVSLPGVGSRIATLQEVSQSPAAQADYSLVERTAAQQITWAIFADNPLHGVGPANIAVVWNDYNDQADIVVRRTVAPHNLYLQLAAEGGVIGVLGWLVFFVGALVLVLRVLVASPATRGRPPPSERLLAAGALSALLGWAVASAFLHLSYFRTLLAVVAVVAVLHDQLRIGDRPDAELWDDRHTTRRAGKLSLVFASCALLVLAMFAIRGPREPEWVARVPVTLVPPPNPAHAERGYSYDLLGRDTLIHTLASVIDRRGVGIAQSSGGPGSALEVGVSGSSDHAVVTVEVRGADHGDALRVALAIAAQGAGYINGSEDLSALARARVGDAVLQRSS